MGQSSAWERSGLTQQNIRIFISEKGAFNLEYTNDSFKSFFKEPYETLMAVLNDRRYILLTEQKDSVMNVSSGIFQYVIEMCGCKLENVAIIIHNHSTPKPFSSNDKRFCHQLVYNGFKGKFLVYYPSHNKIREYKY